MYTLHLLIGTRSVTQGCADKAKVGHVPATLLLYSYCYSATQVDVCLKGVTQAVTQGWADKGRLA